MAYPFGPQEPTVIEDTGRLLPKEAYRVICDNLHNREADPLILRSNIALLIRKVYEAEAKLIAVNSKLALYEKQFRAWKPVLDNLRKTQGVTSC